MTRVLNLKLTVAMIVAISCARANDTQYSVNVATVTPSGDKIRGPATITLTGVNGVRQDVQVGVSVTYPAAPDLTLPFIPPIPKSDQQANSAPKTPAATSADAQKAIAAPRVHGRPPRGSDLPSPNDVGKTFEARVDELNKHEEARYKLQTTIQGYIDIVNGAKARIEAFVSSSDAALRSDPSGSTLLSQIPEIRQNVIGPALLVAWPNSDISQLASDLAILKNHLSALPVTDGWAAWSADTDHRSAYDKATTRVNDLITLVAAMDSSTNQSAASMADAQKKLYQWNLILDTVNRAGKSAFTRILSIGCTFGFANNKESKVEMLSTDRLAAAGAAASRQEIVTVVCSSPLSVSGGFGFSTVNERDIDLIQSSKVSKDSSGNATTQNISIFGYKGRSAFRPLPLLLLNARLYEWSENIAFQFSNGAAVDIKTGSAAGTDVEFISGLSLSFSRTFFLTAGLHAGRVPHLAGGFTIGQEVPQGITKAPIENHWSPGFIVAFTYKLR